MPDAGALNRKITIQTPSEAQDEFGQPTQDWTDVATTWAAIKAPTSKEIYALGAGFTAQVTHKITIRYRAGLTSAMRVCYRGRIFHIQAISDPDESRVQLDLLCLEIDKGHDA
jgi:SPP1 family predicted phage head-tail adaptor